MTFGVFVYLLWITCNFSTLHRFIFLNWLLLMALFFFFQSWGQIVTTVNQYFLVKSFFFSNPKVHIQALNYILTIQMYICDDQRVYFSSKNSLLQTQIKTEELR